MKKFLAMLAVVNLSMAALAGDTPMMVSFKDLKWTELPERPGMQFAVLSGDPKTGSIHRSVKSRPGLTIRCTRTAASSRMSLSVVSGTPAPMRHRRRISGPDPL